MKVTKQNYEALKNQYDPWTDQLVFNTYDGKQMVLEFLREDREFYLLGLKTKTTKGMKAIDEKINTMIDNDEIAEMFIDSL